MYIYHHLECCFKMSYSSYNYTASLLEQMLYAVMYADGQGTASNDQLVIAEHEILDGCPETGLYLSYISSLRQLNG